MRLKRCSLRCKYFVAWALVAGPADSTLGCLLTNRTVDFTGSDSVVNAEIGYGFELFLIAFSAQLGRAPHANPETVARKLLRLLAYYQGLLVLVRHGHDKAALRDTVTSEIEAITEGLYD